MPRKMPTTPARCADDERRRREILGRSIAWDTNLDPSGWPPPPSWWTEEHADEIRRNHGLRADERLIPISKHGAELDDASRGLDLLLVGSRCEPDSLEVLEDIGVPRLTLSSLTPPHERRVLVIWLIRIEQAGTVLRLERRVSLRGEFIHGETPSPISAKTTPMASTSNSDDEDSHYSTKSPSSSGGAGAVSRTAHQRRGEHRQNKHSNCSPPARSRPSATLLSAWECPGTTRTSPNGTGLPKRPPRVGWADTSNATEKSRAKAN